MGQFWSTKYWENCQNENLGLNSIGDEERTTEITTQRFHEPGHRRKEETVLVSVINKNSGRKTLDLCTRERV